FASAADRVEKILAEIETDAAREQLVPTARALRHGATIFARAQAALESNTLPPEPPIKLSLNGQERGGDLVGFDKDKRAVKLKATTQRGGVSTNVPLLDFASADGLRQLIFVRMELSREERADFAELMIVVEVARWAERIVPLVDRMARYDPNDGWTDALREGLELPPAIALVNDVRSV